MTNYILLGVLGVALVYLYLLYVSLVQKKNKLKESLSDIDVQLKKRYDLIPNILNMAAEFMTHEKTLFEEIVRLRSAAMNKNFSSERIELDEALEEKMKSFWLNMENYPDLKSSQTMMQAMQTFEDTEEHIAAARRFYNAALNELKNAVEIFPSSLVAKIVGIKADSPFFSAPEKEKQRIDVKDFFK